MSEMRRLLELVRLEKAALQRWIQELEQRELTILHWLESDERSDAARASEGETK